MKLSPEQEDILLTLDQVSQAVEVLQGVVRRLREQVVMQARGRQGEAASALAGVEQDGVWGELDVVH